MFEGGSGRKWKIDVLPPFPASDQEDVLDPSDDWDYLMVFKSKFSSVFLNLDETINEKFHI